MTYAKGDKVRIKKFGGTSNSSIVGTIVRNDKGAPLMEDYDYLVCIGQKYSTAMYDKEGIFRGEKGNCRFFYHSELKEASKTYDIC